MICKKCKKEFDESKQVMILVKKILQGFKCPHCNRKYFKVPKQDRDLIKLQNGQLVRKDKKIKMSKKERLGIRKEALVQ